MNLHSKIMNILAFPDKAGTTEPRLAYLHGHRDARHAAAEIASQADELLAEISNAVDDARSAAADSALQVNKLLSDISKATDMSQVRRLLIQAGCGE